MKKIFSFVFGLAVLFTACTENQLPQFEQNPYRTIEEYNPHSFTMNVEGTLTPDAAYDWITLSQSGNTATFTVRRNTTGLIRRAEFTQSGTSEKCIVNQKAHSLDASISGILANLDLESGLADINFEFKSSSPDDYESWGYIVSMSNDIAAGTNYPMGNASIDKKSVQLENIEEGKVYYIWGYIKSTEGDQINSNLVAIFTIPVLVKDGDDLQAAINSANQFQEVRVQGGVTFTAPNGGIQMGGSNVNKSVSGGWNSDFTAQSMDNLTKLDGNKSYGFWCANQGGDPMPGYCNISYFEIFNCKGDHGTAVHCVGGPITVSNCYVHDNSSEKGAIGTNEGGAATTLNVVNCIVSNNGADAHGPAFGFGEGKSDTEPVVATLVNNLIIDNVSTKKDGYASTFIAYNQTRLIFVNNTVVGNKNWAEYSGPYSGMVLRGDIASCFVNNIMVGNYTSPCTKEMEAPEYERQNEFLNMGGGAGTLANNLYEGAIRESGNITIKDQINADLGFDISTVLTADYQPLGKALGAGTLGTVTYNSKKSEMGGPFTVDIKALLEKYKVDLAGNPRITNGKVDLGCYQAQ